MPLSAPAVDPRGKPNGQFMDTTGDGTGTKVATGDFSAVTTDFIIKPPEDVTFSISNIIIQIEDFGNFNADIYGAGAVLPNGISLLLLDNNGNIESNFMNSIPITSNARWAMFNFDIDLQVFGSGNNFMSVRCDCKNGTPLLLYNQSMVMRLSDDFTFLASHTFYVRFAFLDENLVT